MKLQVMLSAFNSFGGGAEFGPVSALIGMSEQDLGSGLERIELTLCFRSSKPFEEQGVDKSLRGSYRAFHRRLETLPNRRFLRKKRRLTLEAVADFASAEEVRDWRPDRHLGWQRPMLDLLIDEVAACRRKFKASDDFRVADFLGWLRALELPDGAEATAELLARWKAFEEAEREQMSDWERLGFDWDDFHPDARSVVDDPRLWSQGHDFAPNGNDNGADLMSRFREDKSRSSRNGGKAFYQRMQRDWGFGADAAVGDSIEYQMRREVVLGLACAFLKLYASCPA
jgi:hypothetical protein